MNRIQPTDILIFALFVWLAILSFYLFRTVGAYKKLTRGSNNIDLSKVLEGIIKKSQDHEDALGKTANDVSDFQNRARSFLQKFTLIRFNPFEEEGGDQSFVVSILNGKNDGVVISSLHSRSGVRVYAKQVEGGKPLKHQFTKEEKEAVEKSARQV